MQGWASQRGDGSIAITNIEVLITMDGAYVGGDPTGFRLHFLPLWRKKIIERLGRALAGSAHSRCISFFESPGMQKEEDANASSSFW